ncbi:TPA: tryptophan synthase subunit alpha [Citrobacter amalonaticus]|nr:tryptophan synthase subunit alpha [Citrobacter amalonaticus]
MQQAPPTLQGFDVSTPDQVEDAISAGATGAISGSAIVRIIEKNRDNEETMLAELKAFVMSMKAATRQQ